MQRYVERNLSAGALSGGAVYFNRVGEMQLKVGRWSPFQAEQDMAVDRRRRRHRCRFFAREAA